MVTRAAMIALSLVALVSAFLWFTGTRGGREFFSPYTLELRGQSEFTLLYGSVPLYRSPWEHIDNPMITYLRDTRLVVPQPTATDQQLAVFHRNDAWKDGDGLLYNVFHRDRERIIAWCKEDPERARIYWTECFRHLRANNPSEVDMGEWMLSFCWQAKSVDELKQKIAAIEHEYALPP